MKHCAGEGAEIRWSPELRGKAILVRARLIGGMLMIVDIMDRVRSDT